MAARKTTKAISFEEGLSRLEMIAEQLERGELPLDELLKLYEEGVKLSGELTQKLDQAQGQMMEVRTGKDGTANVVPADVVRQEKLFDTMGEGGQVE